jgi:hypothetical protein
LLIALAPSDLIGRELRCSAQDGEIVKIVGAIVKIVKGEYRPQFGAVKYSDVCDCEVRPIESFASAKDGLEDLML